jgi:hypothetical protein
MAYLENRKACPLKRACRMDDLQVCFQRKNYEEDVFLNHCFGQRQDLRKKDRHHCAPLRLAWQK